MEEKNETTIEALISKSYEDVTVAYWGGRLRAPDAITGLANLSRHYGRDRAQAVFEGLASVLHVVESDTAFAGQVWALLSDHLEASFKRNALEAFDWVAFYQSELPPEGWLADRVEAKLQRFWEILSPSGKGHPTLSFSLRWRRGEGLRPMTKKVLGSFSAFPTLN